MNRTILLLLGVFLALLITTGWSLRRASQTDDARVAAELRLVKLRDFLARNLPAVKQSVEHLPGSAHARMALLEASRQFLADLVQEGVGDPASRTHLATVYQQTADLEASLAPSDIFYYSKSADNYRKAIELRQQLKRTDEPSRAALVDLYTRLAIILQQFGKPDDAKTAVTAAEPFYHPNEDRSPDMKQKAARMFSTRGHIALQENGAPGAEAAFRKALSILEDRDPQSKYEIARATRLLAMLLGHNQPVPEALEQATRSVDIGESLLTQFPTRDDFRRSLAASYVVQAALLPPTSARPVFDKALESAAFTASDPYDVQAGSELVYIACRLAEANHDNAAAALNRTRLLTAPLLQHFPKSYTAASDQITLGLETARYHRRKGQPREALEALKHALPIASALAAEYPNLGFVTKRLTTVQEEMRSLQ